METETLAQEGIAEIVARVAGAMEAAVKDYGPDAVELALLAYQINAIQSVLIGALCLFGLSYVPRYIRWLKSLDDKAASYDKGLAYLVGGFFGCLCGGFLLTRALEGLTVAKIAAAVGYPELLIATNALKAAGLM